MPPECEHRRTEISRAVLAALDVVRDFAARHGWLRHVSEPFFHAVEICRTPKELWRRILELNNAHDVPMPTDAVTAALESGILLAVPREEAERNRPEYFREPDDWMRALAHEMIYRLHVRILSGDEDAMGPQWFYEGFAVVGSGQHLGLDQHVDSVDRALSLAAANGRGAYACYAAALRFFATRVPLQQLVAKAASPGFEGWLREQAAADGHPLARPGSFQSGHTADRTEDSDEKSNV